MFRKSLSAKLLSVIIIIAVVAFGATIGFTAITVFNSTRANAFELAQEIAQKEAYLVEIELEVPMDEARALAYAFEGMLDTGNTDRATAEAMLRNLLAGHEDYSAVWTVWEADAFDGNDAAYANTANSDETGRFITEFQRVNGTIVSEPVEGYDQEDFYLLARNSGEETILNPYEDTIGGQQVMVTTMAVPIRHNDQIVGVIGIDKDLVFLQDEVDAVTPFETGYGVVIANNGRYAAHPDPQLVNTAMIVDETGQNIDAVRDGQALSTLGYNDALGTDIAIEYMPINVGRSTTPWSFAVGIPMDRVVAEPLRITLLIIGIAVASLIILVIVTLIMVRSLVKPIRNIAGVAESISNGDFSQKIDVKSEDEVGTLAKSLKNMINGVIGEGQSLKKGIASPFFIADKELNVTYMNQACADLTGYSIEEVIGKMKCKDLFKSDICDTSCALKKAMADGTIFIGANVKIKNKEGKEIPISADAAALTDLEGNVIGGYEIARDITSEWEIQHSVAETTEQVTSAAGEIASSSEEMATGAEQQSRQTSEVATAIEQMSETILETSKNAEEALKAAQQANKDSEEGGEIVSETIEAVRKIADSTKEVVEVLNSLSTQSEQIGQVVEVIDDIADQTNLLAVNAAIEAARAGEHGRGFAVVADEVRKLAERTLKTTKEVTSTVKSIQKGTKDTVDSVQNFSDQSDDIVVKANKAQESFTKIVEDSKKVMDVSQQVATAADEQSSAAEEISKNIESVASVTKQVASGAQQSSSAAQQLNKLSESLSEVVKKLNLSDN